MAYDEGRRERTFLLGVQRDTPHLTSLLLHIVSYSVVYSDMMMRLDTSKRNLFRSLIDILYSNVFTILESSPQSAVKQSSLISASKMSLPVGYKNGNVLWNT